MAAMETIHVLDGDVRRRATVASKIHSLGLHAELYEALTELEARPPRSGVILVHDDADGPSVAEIVRMVEEAGSFAPLAFYSLDIKPERIVMAMLSGALDYLQWPIVASELRGSLDRLGSSNRALLAKRRKEASARQLVEKLSGREHEVLRALVNGASNKDMARVFGISPRTVEIHRGNMMRKLDASTTSDAVRIGMFAGLGL